MRIVNREQFMSLPYGTIYCKCDEFGNPDEPRIKYNNAGSNVDWYCTDLANLWADDIEDSGQLFDRLKEMITTGKSYPLGDIGVRDGLFEAEQLFLIYELEDLKKLRGFIDVAIQNYESSSAK